ncbi:hypothetical protein EIP91_010906 [Steccherinum ochraceum]|uniref:Oxidoreductase-like domain-containing protein n=1 Tax=Steccherinum ochraceum TaxID=92696 RepID=A0A4V2MX19_9APHY|nr:hypothetical protein EIP91_010906 [Steccherinum ochraceum]
MLRLSRLVATHDTYVTGTARLTTRPVIPYKPYSKSSIPPEPPRLSPIDVARKKHPIRGGQNLSMRYGRLERSLRGKEGYDLRIAELKDEGGLETHTSAPSTSNKKMFMGFVIPEKPRPPADDECCMSGCAICVYDLYEEALTDYNDKVSSLRTSLQVLHVPEDEWPESIKPSRASSPSARNTILSAFEELEQRLKQKHESESLTSPAEAAVPLVTTPPPQSIAPSDSGLTPFTPTSQLSTKVYLLADTEHDPPSDRAVAFAGPPQRQDITTGRRRRRRKTKIPDALSVYEGVRWVLFGNR